MTVGSGNVTQSARRDDELLLAYAQWRAANFTAELFNAEHAEAEVDRLHNTLNHLERRIAELPAHGAAGLAVKIRVVLAGIMDSRIDVHHAFVCDDEPPASVKADCYPGMLWATIVDAERLAEEASTPTPQRLSRRRHHLTHDRGRLRLAPNPGQASGCG